MNHHRIFNRHISIAPSVVGLLLSALLPTLASAQQAEGKGNAALPGSADPTVRTANKAMPGLTEARPDLTVDGRDVSGEVGRPIPLKISVRQTGDVTVEGIRALGLPPGFMISDLVHIFKSIDRDDIVDLTDWSIADLRITQPERPLKSFKLSLSVIWKARHRESIEVSSTEFTVRTHARPGSVDRPASDMVGVEMTGSEPNTRDTGAIAPLRRIPGTDPAPAAPNPPKTDGPPPGSVARIPGAAETRPVVPLSSGPASERPVGAGSLVERARGLIKRGDISGARLFLERARARDEPEATFLLAQTWDPDMLRRWNVLGLRPDPERARALYAEAAERGRADDRSLAARRP